MDELPAELQRPSGVSDLTVEGTGALRKSLETAIRVRGALYEFHQLLGKADEEVGKAIDLLRRAGHYDAADELETKILGRNVNDRRWSFQIVEDFDRTYYEPFVSVEREIRQRLADGRQHQREAELKQDELTPGEPGYGH